MIVPDLMIALSYLEQQRKVLGKHDEKDLKIKKIEENVSKAYEGKKLIERSNEGE